MRLSCCFSASSIAQVFVINSKGFLENIAGLEQNIAIKTSITLLILCFCGSVLGGFMLRYMTIKNLHILILFWIEFLTTTLYFVLQTFRHHDKQILFMMLYPISITAGMSLSLYPIFLYKIMPVAVRETGIRFSI